MFVVDRRPDSLRLAHEAGATPVDRGVEAIGYQAHDSHGDEDPSSALNQLVQVVKATGGIWVVAVYLPQDPGAADELARKGKIAFDFGMFWFTGQSMGTGQCNVKACNVDLQNLITAGVTNPGFIVSHELDLTEAATGHQKFDERQDGWTKVVLHPGNFTAAR